MSASKSLAVCLTAATLLGSVLASAPADAQYGGGYGYDRRAPDPDDYDRRRDRDYDRGGRDRDAYGRRDRDRDYDRPRRRDEGRDDRGGGPSVRGAFVQSCVDIRQNGPILEATCRGRGGGQIRSSIDTRNCRRGIGNNNGRLTCE